MKIIITAGGTTEKIDRVRKITNTATGKLGSLIAGEFVKQGGCRIEKIFYVCEKGTIIPGLDCVKTIPVEGVDSVKNALENLLSYNKIDAVIHSMAVSDYTVDSLTTAQNLSEFLAKKLFPLTRKGFQSYASLAKFIAVCIEENDAKLARGSKISSNIENLMLFMKQTPKLIGLIKTLQPSAVLVGFKLLNNVDKQSLLNVGYELLVKNSCDLVLANDSNEIDENRHIGYLISPDMSYSRFETKQEIACGIVRKVLNLIENKESLK